MLYIALAAALAAGCGGQPTAAPTTTAGTPAPTVTAQPTPTAATPVAADSPVSLRVWLPPAFAPDVDSAGGRVLADQFSAFEAAHPGVAVEVRLKAEAGPGGLLNALVTAANAAPGALPHVVALRRDDLATAAAAGLAQPLDALLPAEVLNDYYPFAQAMGRPSGPWAGLPFAADARVMAYATRLYSTPPLRWSDVVSGTFVLPAGEPDGLTVMTMYLALGGTLADEAGPALDANVLAQALEALRTLQAAGTLPLAALDYADTAATWQVFRERRAALAVTSAQRYLSEYFRVAGASATLLPSEGQTRLALADGWSWAIVNAQPEHAALCAELLAWLAAPERHAAWTEAAQVLPTRAATLAAWESERLVPFVSDVVTHAELQPPAGMLAVMGPPLQQALRDVLDGRATPFAAAASAAQLIAEHD
jgi:ABC-type glycerol-3-phosphate transport system substrate-binding protein